MRHSATSFVKLLQDCERSVEASVVDEQDLERDVEPSGDRKKFIGQGADVLLLVENRDDE
jgi:hypothetical protein